MIAIDGVPITGQAGLVATIRDRVPGDSVHVDLVRAGAPLTVVATLGDRPSN